MRRISKIFTPGGAIVSAAHSATMTSSIAFVGAGPTTIYTLAAYLASDPRDAAITIFEQQATPGLGTPYRGGWNDPAMLANIASIEIPPVRETLLHWLQARTPEELQTLGVAPDEIDDRAFYPRVVLGRYFADQFSTMVSHALAEGVDIEVRRQCRVIDAFYRDDGVRLTIAPMLGFVTDEQFDHVVLATGHQWPSEQDVRPGYFLTPWPASKLSRVPPVQVGILGSSLTGIDTAVGLAVAHGEFVDEGKADLTYVSHPETEGFSITMMSRKGLLPEADFYFPLPHKPLTVCTEDALTGLIQNAKGDLLEDAFALFKEELSLADPAYAQSIGLAETTLETFSEAYFAPRAAADPFEWAQANLEEAQRNHEARFTVPWRYAILRMHEVIGTLTPHLNGEQFERFERHFKPIFVDDYGAAPHASIQRLLALRRAGKLRLMALGNDYKIDTQPAHACGVIVRRGSDQWHFPVFIEATGQRALSAREFPFPSLLAQGVIVDEGSPDAPQALRGVALDDVFHPVNADIPSDRLFCLSLPFLMGRHPFAQGITSSHDLGAIVGAALAEAVAGSTRTPVQVLCSHAA